MSSTLVLGIGNSLLSDEGAGVHAVRVLQDNHPDLPGVTCLDAGTLSFTLAGAIEDADNLIVFDAARLDAAPGTVRCFEGEAMDRFVGRGKLSVHEVGLADLLDIARLTGYLPEHRALIGIQPGCLDWGAELSQPVAGALPDAIARALKLIVDWSETTEQARETVQ